MMSVVNRHGGPLRGPKGERPWVLAAGARDNHFRPFYKHQWLDVKDSIAVWSESQIIEVDEKKQNIRIHYKG
jgi:hypothetical protein